MESDPDDLDNIFEENENNLEADNTENGENSYETSTGVKIAPPKRIVKNPRLKFNPERLCGERGIPILLDHFKDVKFKGAGHEKEDLDKLLSKLEHWTHRLFPSMKFNECLAHIEKLGKKRPVQTCLRKIRLDMPILSSDFVKEDGDDVRRNDASEPEETDPFDRLIGESHNAPSFSTSADEIIPDDSFPVPDKTSGHVLGSSFGASLSDEQKERMERNKMLAAERRKARLAAQQSMESNSGGSDRVSSQDINNAENSYNKIFDSAYNNSETVNTTNDDFDKIFNQDRISTDESVFELNNKDSENLGLDDLVDLVDEDESTSLGETLVTNVQNNCDEIIDSVDKNKENIKIMPNYDSPDNVNKDLKNSLVESSSELSGINSENLGLDDLVDLVGEDEAPLGVTSSQHLKSVSCHSGKTDESMEVFIDDDNISNVEESKEVRVSDRIDDGTTSCSKTSCNPTEENMEMEPLLEVVDEASRDSRLIDDNFSNVKESNEARVSDKVDDVTTLCSNRSCNTGEENMEMESLFKCS